MKAFIFITLLSSLFSYNTNINYASSSFQGRAYDSSQKLVIDKDLTQEELNRYYQADINTLTSKKGEELQTYLYNIISKDNYFVRYKDVTNWYKITDRNYNLSTNKIDPDTYTFSLDSGNNYYLNLLYFTDTSTISKQINTDINSFSVNKSLNQIDWENKLRPSAYFQVDKEHVFVKSHGFPPSKGADPVQGAGTDLHHLIAADHNTNNIHNDLYYGEVVSSKKEVVCYYADGSNDISGWTGLNKDGEKVFEPTDQYKGDVARALFYMATRYSNKLDTNTESEPYLILTDDVNAVDDNSNYHGVFHNLSTFLKWNKLDPVSEYEIHRNNLIYYNVQNNRNPFVDYPYLADYIYDPENAHIEDNFNFNLKNNYQLHADDTISINLPSISENTTLSLEYDNSILEITNENNTLKIKGLKVGSNNLTFKFETTDEKGEKTTKTYTTNISVIDKPSLEITNNNLTININNLDIINLNCLSELSFKIENLLDSETLKIETSNSNVISIQDNSIKALLPGQANIKLIILDSNSNSSYTLIEFTINNSISKTQIFILIGIAILVILIIIILIVILSKSSKKKKNYKPNKKKKYNSSKKKK